MVWNHYILLSLLLISKRTTDPNYLTAFNYQKMLFDKGGSINISASACGTFKHNNICNETLSYSNMPIPTTTAPFY